MKPTFFHLPEEKQLRILQCSILEFAERGFEKGSTDRIVAGAGISKGGLYEYIESKTDLFIFTLNFVYDSLYTYIEKTLDRKEIPVSTDLIERVRAVSSVAIDFYLANPGMIRLMYRVSMLEDQELKSTLENNFQRRFLHVFGDIDDRGLTAGKDRILDLFKWLLVKTRNEFLHEFDQSGDQDLIRKRYLNIWNFYLDVLKHGIYRAEQTDRRIS